jgi:hypothetical protein
MRLMASVLLGVAAIAATASTSRAEDGCGRGWYWNGYNCAPYRYVPRPQYDYRDYDRWRWHHHHDYDDEDHDGPRYYRYNYNDGARYYPPNPKWHTSNGCPPHFTVQDGLCKPYRGY